MKGWRLAVEFLVFVPFAVHTAKEGLLTSILQSKRPEILAEIEDELADDGTTDCTDEMKSIHRVSCLCRMSAIDTNLQSAHPK